jgi:hypothetical protein
VSWRETDLGNAFLLAAKQALEYIYIDKGRTKGKVVVKVK